MFSNSTATRKSKQQTNNQFNKLAEIAAKFDAKIKTCDGGWMCKFESSAIYADNLFDLEAAMWSNGIK
jgi:ABC-type proline/glycine betaine transport system substrate-binding protein